jgi:hypothetical protein
MTDHSPRLFSCDADIEHIGEGLMARRLPRAEWTHEAHLAATAYLVLRRPELDLDAELSSIIRSYNASVGGVNDATQGYHDTITRVYLRGVRMFLAEADRGAALRDLVNALLLSPIGRRDWPLRFYSKERLMSVAARLKFVEPDLAPLPSCGYASALPKSSPRRRLSTSGNF